MTQIDLKKTEAQKEKYEVRLDEVKGIICKILGKNQYFF